MHEAPTWTVDLAGPPFATYLGAALREIGMSAESPPGRSARPDPVLFKVSCQESERQSMPINNLNGRRSRPVTGSEQLVPHSLVRSSHTRMARNTWRSRGAYWLLDEIALAQKFTLLLGAEPSSLKLTVNDRRGL